MRLLRHLFPPSAGRLFPESALARIAEAVEAGEARHTGEVCFAVEAALPASDVLRGRPPRDRALEAFGLLGVWDTEANNGVLVYLLLADHAIEIVPDRAAARAVDRAAWDGVCRELEAALRSGHAEAGVLAAVERISALLELHFPRVPGGVDANELPDRPRLL